MASNEGFLFEDLGCFVCGEVSDLQRHYVNGDHGDESASNVVRLCEECHVAVHRAPGRVDWVLLHAWRGAVLRFGGEVES
jgi:hypothetical protein